MEKIEEKRPVCWESLPRKKVRELIDSIDVVLTDCEGESRCKCEKTKIQRKIDKKIFLRQFFEAWVMSFGLWKLSRVKN